LLWEEEKGKRRIQALMENGKITRWAMEPYAFAFVFEPVPALGTRIAASFLRGMTRAHGEVIGVLALEQVLAQQALSALIASHAPH